MNLIKKNILLVIVLSITIIVAATMIFFVIQATGKMEAASSSVTTLQQEINSLNQEKPAPLQENLERINNDYKQIKNKVKEILPIFGTPYHKALQLFAKELGKTTDEIKEEWRKFYRKEKRGGGNRTLIFVKFKGKFKADEIKKAIQVFTDTVNSKSFEKIDETNINGALMEALGLPRKMDEISCKTYIRNMQLNLFDYMKKAPEGGNPFIFKDNNAEKFSFEKYEESMPRPDEVPYIFKHWKMIEDLFVRMKLSRVAYLDTIVRDNGLKGQIVSQKYLIFAYTMKIKGPLGAIRTFLNSMMGAYKENKVYIIKSITLETNDEAAAILGGTSTGNGGMLNKDRNSFRIRRAAKLKKEKEKEEEKKVNVQVLGISKQVNAEIKFEYIIYIGNEIKTKG